MMEPATLQALLAIPSTEIMPDGLRVTIHREWIIPNEDRLSYASAIRLAECCRELHWKRDIRELAPTLDSIVVRCAADFMHPIITGSRIQIRNAITRIGRSCYDCTIEMISVGSTEHILYSVITLTNVFYSHDIRESIKPPTCVVEALGNMLQIEKS